MSTEKEKYIGESPILGVPEKALRLKLRNESVTMEKLSPEVKSVIDSGGKGVVNVTRADLIDLRENEELVPSRFYRITDYMAPNTYNATKYAGHQFDVMVMALDASSLSQVAYARPHEGDTYFSNCDLNAWQLHYSLGDGEITWMRDEHNNECSYDFKNRLWKRYKVINDVREGLNNYYFAADQVPEDVEYDSSDYAMCYTFTSTINSQQQSDMSVYARSSVINNIIEGEDNVFFGVVCENNKVERSHSNTFGTESISNTLNKCNGNIFGSGAYFNIFSYSDNNSFGNDCTRNVAHGLYGSYFKTATFNSFTNSSYIKINKEKSSTHGVEGNTFSSECSHIIFNSNCYKCTFLASVKYVTFKNILAGCLVDSNFGGTESSPIETTLTGRYLGMNNHTPVSGNIAALF